MAYRRRNREFEDRIAGLVRDKNYQPPKPVAYVKERVFDAYWSGWLSGIVCGAIVGSIVVFVVTGKL